MKKKLFYLFLCLMLLGTAACKGKDKEIATPTLTPTPTATPTPTPTPLPENLAYSILNSIPLLVDNLLGQEKTGEVQPEGGSGCDFRTEFSFGEGIPSLFGLEGLETLGLSGSLDINNYIATNIMLSLNGSDVLEADAIISSSNVYLNLPKYSDRYVAYDFEELFGMTAESFTESLYQGVEGFPTNAEIIALIKKYTTRFVECFEPQTEIETDVTIGTGDYTVTGTKYGLTAEVSKLQSVMDALAEDLKQYPGLEIDTKGFDAEAGTTFYLNYYQGPGVTGAWECYSDNKESNRIVFLSAATGFCFYNIKPDGTEERLIYSTVESDTTGTVVLVNEGTENVFHYTRSENLLAINGTIDGGEFSMSFGYTANGTPTHGTIGISSNGTSFLIDFSVEGDKFIINCEISAFGTTFVTVSMEMTQRKYRKTTLPENYTDIETWASELDQLELLADLSQLMEDYPFLADLFLGSDTSDDNQGNSDGDNWNDPSYNDSAYVPDENYTDEFMKMTGYSIDKSGYVDFNALEEEVLAIGKPSTGMASLKITEKQKTALLDYAATVFSSCSTYCDSYYYVFGSVPYDNVASYYSTVYSYYDSVNYENSIDIEFDAVSGEFISVSIYNSSKDEALRVANEMLKLLNITYELTAEAAENYTVSNNLLFSGYDSGSYYSIDFSVYNYE